MAHSTARTTLMSRKVTSMKSSSVRKAKPHRIWCPCQCQWPLDEGTRANLPLAMLAEAWHRGANYRRTVVIRKSEEISPAEAVRARRTWRQPSLAAVAIARVARSPAFSKERLGSPLLTNSKRSKTSPQSKTYSKLMQWPCTNKKDENNNKKLNSKLNSKFKVTSAQEFGMDSIKRCSLRITFLGWSTHAWRLSRVSV